MTDKPRKKITRSKVHINNKKQDGLFEHISQVWPDTAAGSVQSWKYNSVQHDAESTIRNTVITDLDQLDDYARSILISDKAKRSTKDLLQVLEQDGSDERERNGQRYRAWKLILGKAPEHSIAEAAINLGYAAMSVRLAMDAFEDQNPETPENSTFYHVLQKTLDATSALNILTLKRFEREIIRGQEKNYNHMGATETEQKKAVTEVQRLMADEGLSQGKAVDLVRKNVGRNESTVRKWMRNFKK